MSYKQQGVSISPDILIPSLFPPPPLPSGLSSVFLREMSSNRNANGSNFISEVGAFLNHISLWVVRAVSSAFDRGSFALGKMQLLLGEGPQYCSTACGDLRGITKRYLMDECLVTPGSSSGLQVRFLGSDFTDLARRWVENEQAKNWTDCPVEA